MRRSLTIFAILISASTAMAQGVPKGECQTKESIGLRFKSIEMAKAAEESGPPMCDGCSEPTEEYDAQRVTQDNFNAQSLAALYNARALEAAECPQYADRLLAGVGIASSDQQEVISSAYNVAAKKEYDRLAALKDWQKQHPQCEHVAWWAGSDYSPQDLSGHYGGKKGDCSVDGRGEIWVGSAESLEIWDPDQNKLILQVCCAEILQKNGLFEGTYADPKFCETAPSP